MTRSLNELDLLAAAGVKLGVDVDGSLRVEMPAALDAARLEAYVRAHAGALRDRLLWRAKGERRMFLGGPFDGRTHQLCIAGRATIVLHVQRGKWAAYRPIDAWGHDGRLVFVGCESNQRAARELAWQAFLRVFPARARPIAPRRAAADPDDDEEPRERLPYRDD